MPGLTDRAARQQRAIGPLLMAAVVLGLLGLPVAVWLDLRGLSERLLRLQASETGRIIDDMRSFYASDVVGRVLQAHGQVTTGAADYEQVPGAIPIPATLSIELGNRISAHDGAVKYRFVSDLPFHGRRASRARPVRERRIDGLARRSRPDRGRGRPARSSTAKSGSPPRCAWARSASPATTPTPTARNATGRSATCAASRRSRSRSPWAATSSPSNTCSPISCSPPPPASPSS